MQAIDFSKLPQSDRVFLRRNSRACYHAPVLL